IVIRRPSLAETMSDYLIREIEVNPGIAVRAGTQIVGGGGDGRLEHLVLRAVRTGEESAVAADALFVMIGGEPRTDWLADVVARDDQGYVVTRGFVETSMPGVFAVGDVRRGATKR